MDDGERRVFRVLVNITRSESLYIERFSTVSRSIGALCRIYNFRY